MVFVSVWLLSESSASAQAWVSPKGTLGVGVGYTYDTADTIVEDGGSIEIQGDSTTVHTTSLSAEYVPIDKLGIQAQLPILTSRYKGTGSLFDPHGPNDDGDYHTAIQDFRLDARYMLLEEPLVVTPQIGFSIPVTDYETTGFTSAGRGLKQAFVGINIARTLDPILPRLYFHASYQFSLAEKYDEHPDTEQYSQNRSQIGFQTGYQILDNFGAYIAFDGFFNHDGINFIDYADTTGPEKTFHDGILKEQAMLFGGGLTYSPTDQMSFGGAFRLFLDGDNTRKVTLFVLSASFEWSLLEGSDGATEGAEEVASK